MVKTFSIFFIITFCLPYNIMTQEEEKETQKVPAISILRAEESYIYLDSIEKNLFFLQPLKLLTINRKNNIFLTLGGEYRARVEHYTNENYTDRDLTYYSQRVNLHASLMLGTKFRLFGELYSGYVTGNENLFLESDEIDVHQGFLEWKPINSSGLKTTIRLGRQEIGYGASRIVGIREGPNMRRTFDMVRVIAQKNSSSMDLFYGKEVNISPFSFDNKSNIFKGNKSNPVFWGAYYRRPFLSGKGKLDFYYFGFYANSSRFNDVLGKETRHSIGVRSFGTKGRLSYNTEIIIQWGKLDNSDIFAYNIETDWKYTIIKNDWKPKLGIKTDWSSGDQHVGDGKVGTFNPIFVNPAIYSLAAVNTPANITSLHPNFTFYPLRDLTIYLDYAFFYRTQSNDGLYTPPRFLTREANGIRTKHVGDVFGLKVSYEVNRNISFDLRSSYFIAGEFIKASGDSENTFYIAPTMSFKF